ncbi:MAG: glycosyltransferase family 2 protein [Methanobacterium sp.]|uniref:glycosyltransferase family 2 protein n=1 Tax=Methanobacterium sp. TaxID=2164 RepID=UPI003D658A46|nr:glycosyltransferase family 2 protein [Methanobacterium sp.]
MTQVTVLIPAYNEEISLGSIVLSAKKYADTIIVVDDGSSDRTSEIARLAGAEVIKHPLNQGKGAALRTGFKAIKSLGLGAGKSDIIVTMDSDGQHNPEEIPKIIRPIEDGEADIVNGSRYIEGKEKNTPIYRRFGQTVLDTATNVGSGIPITDSQSGFRAFAASTVPTFRFSCADFGIESEMLIDAANAGLKIKEVKIGVRYDVDSSTKNPLFHGLEVLVNILNDIEFQRPLVYFTLPGGIIIIIGLMLGLAFFRDYVTGLSTNLAATILSILLTLGGAFLALTGIILDSMSRMINKMQNKPSINIIHPDETNFKSTIKDQK